MKTSLDTIRNGLVAQLGELDRDLEKASEQVNELKLSRRKVAAAIKALGGSDEKEPTKPAPKKQQVQKAVLELLTDNNDQLPLEDLESLVAEKLASEQGCSAMGLALRMREVLAGDEFITKGGQVELRNLTNGTPTSAN